MLFLKVCYIQFEIIIKYLFNLPKRVDWFIFFQRKKLQTSFDSDKRRQLAMAIFTLDTDYSSETSYALDNSRQTDNNLKKERL